MKVTASSIFVAASALLFSLSAAAAVGEGVGEGFGNRGRGGVVGNGRGAGVGHVGEGFPAVALGRIGEDGGHYHDRDPVRIDVNVKPDHKHRYGDYDGYHSTKYYYPIDNAAPALWAGNAVAAAAGMALLAAL